MEALASWPLVPILALAVPLALALTAMVRPRRASLASAFALGLSVLFAIGAALAESPPGGASTRLFVRADTATCVMLLLVTALGLVVVRFSTTYLQGDTGVVRYLRWLLLTLSAVTALVVTDNLLVLALAWTATSLALHQLLTFYSDRRAALVASHKKFLVSRLADACLGVSLSLVHANVQSFEIDRIDAWVKARSGLPLSMEVAALLLVVAVALRSAQLPFHGWITQVMEAPTPVSALLHAGVVNIGGFVLIRLAPWTDRAEPARWLLLGIGLVSTVAAALIMTTRVSVKVALAWSTCAQMGFMLVQCALGLWPLALLHLVAHSLYKAHAFLSAGSAVDEWRFKASTRARPPVSLVRLCVSVLLAVGGALFVVAVVGPRVGSSCGPSELVLALLVGLSLVPLLVSGMASGAGDLGATAARMAGVVTLYLGGHGLAEHLVKTGQETSDAALWGVAGAGFLLLFAVKATLQIRPGGAFARALRPWLFSGLYLDELFTRLTFRVWPPRFPRGAESHGALQAQVAVEVRT